MNRISKTAKHKVIKELEFLKYYPSSRNHKDVADNIENIIIESFCRQNNIEHTTKEE